MMDERVIKQMSKVKDDVDKRVSDTVNNIVLLAWAYKYKGKNFKFSVTDSLEEQTDVLIGELCNYLIEDNNTRVDLSYGYASEQEMIDDLYDYVERDIHDKTRTDRYESYCDRLKKNCEAWLAAGFLLKLTQWQVISNIISGNPAVEARARKEGYDGKIYNGIPDRLTVLGQSSIADAFAFGTIESFAQDPQIIGYRVQRGSSYPCDTCDDLTRHVYPLDDIVIPVHPRCVCYAVPVYKDGK